MAAVGAIALIGAARAESLAERLSGRILLQVEAHGEAWYVNPVNQQRYYLARPADTLRVMKELGLGVANDDWNAFFRSGAPKRLAGRILLRVHDRGQAAYVNPLNLRPYELGSPEAAFKVLRELGLGISNRDLGYIEANPTYVAIPYARYSIEASDEGAWPAEITVAAGSEIDLLLKIRKWGVARGGLTFQASGYMSDISEIKAGESRLIKIFPVRSFSYTPFLPNTNIRLPYTISVNVK